MVVALANIKRTKGRSAVKFASEHWLNFSFGVRPLLSDIQSASDAIASYLARTDKSLIIHGSASKEWLGGQVLRGQTGPYGVSTLRSTDVKHKLSYRFVGGVNLRLASSNNYGLTETFGLDIGKTLPSLGWELLPFSWVADYFVNVGAYLGDTFQLPSGALKYLVVGKRYSMEGRFSIRTDVVAPDPPVACWAYSVPGRLAYKLFQRTKLPAIPHIGLRFKSVDQVGINAVNKLLNLVSLVGSGVDTGSPRKRIRF
jgi:hypothetical protein